MTKASFVPRALPTNRGLRDVIVPHRSYRRLLVTRRGAWLTIPAITLVELVVVLLAQRGLDAMTSFARFTAEHEGIATRSFTDAYLFVTTEPLAFAVRSGTAQECWLALAGCAVALLALMGGRQIAAPIRYFINLNLLLIGAGAACALLVGAAGYTGATFSQLLLRTALVTWLAMPLVAGGIAALFPFSFLERLAFIAITVAFDVPLAIVRYGLFVGILGATRSFVMTDLYLVFGPVLDALPLVCFFSLFLVRAARSFEAGRAVWGWL
jgi:hypothetical protein